MNNGARISLVDDFSRLLAYFADPKVQALILQSDRAIAARVQGEIAALTSSALPDAQLRQLLYTSPLAPQMDALGDTPIQVPIRSPQGHDLIATLSPHRDGLHCALTRSCDARPARHMSIPPNAPRSSRLARPSIPPGASPSNDRPKRKTHPTLAPQSSTPTQSKARATRRTIPPEKPPRSTPVSKQTKPTSCAPRNHTARRPTQRPKTSGIPANAQLGAYLALARESLASDLHLISDSPIMLRRLGRLEKKTETISDEQLRTILADILDNKDQAQLDEKGYADFALQDPEHGRFRVNVCRHKRGLKACLRVLPQYPPSLEELGLPPELGEVLKHHQGLAIIAGPNGQGKSTTLAALVNKLNLERAIHVITVEDPIEVVHPIAKAVITQRQVGRDTKSFHSALKGALREDPDVIVLGELRDRETVEMALSAAETGHLVIATMNTPSGAKTIGRLIDLFPPDDQSQVRATLAGTLMIVAAQRLVPKADQSGMVAAVELITGGVPLWSLIRDNKLVQLPGLMQRGKKMGMIQLEDSLRALMQSQVIDQETFEHYLRLEMGPQPQGDPTPSQSPPQEAASPEAQNPSLRNLFKRKSA